MHSRMTEVGRDRTKLLCYKYAIGRGMGETLEMTLGMQVGISLQRHFSHIPIVYTGKVGKAS